MKNVTIGQGKLAGKGVYAARDFAEDELVMSYELKELSPQDFQGLSKSEHIFTHSFWHKIYLYPEPARYVNHSPRPNTRQDMNKMSDYATRPIKKGEMITTNATLEILREVTTFMDVYTKSKTAHIDNLKWTKLGYRNAICEYNLGQLHQSSTLKRIDGNWEIIT